MAFRDDLLFVLIPVAFFHEFDRKKEIKIPIGSDASLAVGDTFPWECAQFHGVAKVIKEEGSFFTIKKVS